ncbi:hypothetical protein Snov_2904 [Ancylobacter novellus DSM 506]|uniref:Transcriptional regulator n=1 Tax=Ancylobacter novellus (strain ATCC 8093 / DSM 506 / JCM 20403 / CCM 1077 / IAM 12100 / NBRC 12443 / NCIMB 10456) TaxID=639283 RepID=D7A6I9_ANCN5|nr:hypothetical protein Snov_2904 [Ancylobacter novellus DSM 506]
MAFQPITAVQRLALARLRACDGALSSLTGVSQTTVDTLLAMGLAEGSGINLSGHVVYRLTARGRGACNRFSQLGLLPI